MPPSLAERVAAHCRRHRLLAPREPVLALVSGGPDSMCLMHLLPRVHDGPVHVLTFDHGLRSEAAGEAGLVLEAAAALGLPARIVRLGLAPGPGAPARARDARLAAARSAAAGLGGAVVATGHTASDQAETVLLRLARGTGRTGALGMAARGDGIVRPLLCASAEETRAWCARHGVAVADDPSNRDRAHARARVRHGLLRALRDVHPGAERHVAALADVLRDEAELIAPVVAAAGERARAGGAGLAVAALLAEPPAMRRLLVRAEVAAAGLPADAAAGEALARTLDLLERGGRASLPGGGEAAVERGRLVVRARPAEAPAPVPLPVPGRARFGDASISARRGRGGPPAPERVALAVEGPLVVRPPRPGDRLPLPGGGRQAVGRLLAAAGVPAWRRPVVPVVAAGDRVVWVAGHRADPALVAPAGAPAVVLELAAAG